MKAIAAMDLNRVIGNKGQIPWHFPEDFKWFKQKTLESGKMVMGRETFKSVGALPKRFTYVLTNDPVLLALPPFTAYQYVGLDFFNNSSFDDLWVCGGAAIYKLLLPRCSEVFMTHVLDSYEGDVQMPDFEDSFQHSEIVRETKDFWIVRYWK